jgi:hypothetical protein
MTLKLSFVAVTGNNKKPLAFFLKEEKKTYERGEDEKMVINVA